MGCRGKQKVWLGLARGKRKQGSGWEGAGAGRGSGSDGGGGRRAVSVPVLSPVLTPHSSQAVRKPLAWGGGGRLQLHKGLAQPAPLPPPVCFRSQRDDGKSCWSLSAPAGKGHSLKCSQVYTCHAYMYTCVYIPHIPVHAYKCPNAHIRLGHTPTYTFPLE